MPGPTLSDWSSDVAALMSHLGVERAPILAISGGGPFAVATAVHLRRRISGLALVSPLGEVASPSAGHLMTRAQRAFFLGLSKWPRLRNRVAVVARAAFHAAPDVTFAAFRKMLSPADRRILATPQGRRVVIEATREALRTGAHGAQADMSIFGRPWGIDPGAIRVPSVLWQGTGDHIVPARLSFDLGERLPGCTVHRLEGHGHFWVLEHIPEVLEEVARLAA